MLARCRGEGADSIDNRLVVRSIDDLRGRRWTDVVRTRPDIQRVAEILALRDRRSPQEAAQAIRLAGDNQPYGRLPGSGATAAWDDM
jgi:hypothetical protein